MLCHFDVETVTAAIGAADGLSVGNRRGGLAGKGMSYELGGEDGDGLAIVGG